ncbi:MAG TPA: amino acid adenylation domain-containing protein [Epulopiscium sp.]|nr:amino acid adenylation domain-containing protein [Candidatus Epulonipiscium sp.]
MEQNREIFLKKYNLTENTFFIGAYAYAFGKFTGQEEVVINTRGKQGQIVAVTITINEACKVCDYLLKIQKDIGTKYLFDYQDDHTRERFMDMFNRIMEGFLTQSYLMEIPLVSEQDRLIRQGFNHNELAFDRSLTVIDMFREQVGQNPHNTAIVFEQKHMTYKELDILSETLAIYLKKLGVKADKVVGILVNRSDIYPVSFLGILKAGGVYQPLDPKHPEKRLKYMLEDSETGILIIDEDLQVLVPDFKGKIIYTKDIYCLPQDSNIELERPKPEDLFYILYTSGSTGVPKGCMLEHKNIASFCKVIQDTYNITHKNRSVAYENFAIDASTLDFLPFLTSGASVYIMPDEIRYNLPKLDAYFRLHKITNIVLMTHMARQYITEYPDNPFIKMLMTGGEKLLSCKPPNYPFENCYGPTECSVLVTRFRMNKEYKNIPIGKVINNMDVYIVDQYNRELPIMVPGELCVAGYSVSRGYLNQADQSKKVFIPNPFSKQDGYERMYKTGDICRCLEDGNIEFLGRKDSQVSINSLRVELGEIELRIRQFSKVKDAAVIAEEAVDGEKYIAAYITGQEEINIVQLNDFIREGLPSHMLPKTMVQIQTIPLNQNGKVDKAKLKVRGA